MVPVASPWQGAQGRHQQDVAVVGHPGSAQVRVAEAVDDAVADVAGSAGDAGVAKGTLYGYFPDKEELYFAVIFEGISDLNTRLRARVEKDTSPEEKLREMMHALVSFSRQNRFFFKLMSIEDSKSEKGRGENRRRWRDERGKQSTKETTSTARETERKRE